MQTSSFDRRTMLKLGCAAALSTAAPARAQAGSIVTMDATALAAALAARKLSSVEVMTAFLDQIERLNPRVNAIVALQDRAALLAQARDYDAQAARGRIMGPLHGLPIAVKDLQAVKGIRSTSGSLILKDFVPTADSLPVERMRAAGAIFIGKTNAPEFGFGSHTYNNVYGTTTNAYDQSKSAGGSSGGATSALALRMVPLADGSDYGGSLRNPAGWNNVFGFRPSAGVVPVAGADVWIPSMGVTGPMARTVPDLALLLSVLAGFDARAPLSQVGTGAPFRGSLAADFKGKRIGWLGDLGGWSPHEPGVLELCTTALKSFETLGCTVEPALPESPPEAAWQAFMKLRQWQQGGNIRAYYANPAQRALLKPEAVWEVEEGLKLSAYDISAATAARTIWSNAVQRLFARFDFLIMPTAQVFAFDAAEHWPREIAGKSMQTYHEWMKAVCLISLAGCPSLAVPAGFSDKGAMGIQIIAPVDRDLDCFKLAYAYDRATRWTTRKLPPLLSG